MSDMSDPSSRPPRGNGANSTTSLSKALFGWLRGLGGLRTEDTSLRESIEELIDDQAEAEQPVNPDERLMLRNIAKLREVEVGDVMVPRANIVAIAVEATMEEVIERVRQGFHSRMPVYRGTLDDVIGMVHVKDLAILDRRANAFDLKSLARDVLFVPSSVSASNLLSKMRDSRIHMAIVVDEYGGTDGLATIEDLVEEIVGEIEDEYDQAEEPLLIERPDGTLEADARTPIVDLEAKLGIALMAEDRDEDIDSVGGLVASLAGRVPKAGERVAHPDGLEFEIIEADARRIKRLRIQNAPVRAANANR